MTLPTADAEAVLYDRMGEPAKPPIAKVIGFKAPSGKVLAIHREASETRVWFQPRVPPALDGVRPMPSPSNGNSNLKSGPLRPLSTSKTLRVEVDSLGALNRSLDWYLEAIPADPGNMTGGKEEERVPGDHEMPVISEQELMEEPIAGTFRPSRAFPSSFGEQISDREDGPTKLYVATFIGDAAALLGREKAELGEKVLVKAGISNNPERRADELNAGFPPAAVGKWVMALQSADYPDRKAAEAAEKTFMVEGDKRLESLGGEFFAGEMRDIQMLFSSIAGLARNGT